MKGDRYKYLAQVFQSIRIAVNDELGALTQMLIDVADVLNPGGRLVIISYHSLEDKLVKAAFRNDLAGVQEDALMGGKPQLFKVLTRKAILPGNVELKSNPRSTSARLRVAEKC
jgi:16S rRNA (cytosine1402-N4)-methyltransferase